MRRQVAVTGVGLVSCLGHDYAEVMSALRAGRSGVRAMPEWAGHNLKSLVAGVIEGVEDKERAARLPKALSLGMSGAARFCALAALDAVADSGLAADELADLGTGCFVGSGVPSCQTIHRTAELYYAGRVRRADPCTVLRAMSSSPSAAVANMLGIRGRSYSLSSACATSAHNVGHAYELIRDGALERAVAGGGEEVDDLVAAAFSTLRLALSTHYNDTPERASRPYDAHRDGFVVGGGAAIVVLEEMTAARRRGARVRCEIAGFGANSDGYDMVRPEPSGDQVAACMAAALRDAGIEPADVSYINTHGTSTPDGDVAEVRGMRQLFASAMPPFSSTKSMTGHGLGAAGALELVFCTGMIEQGFLAPSINVDEPDPEVADMPLVTEARRATLGTVLSNSFGFGGTNATVVLRRAS